MQRWLTTYREDLIPGAITLQSEREWNKLRRTAAGIHNISRKLKVTNDAFWVLSTVLSLVHR